VVRKPTAFIAYYRVSTQRQGASGLGLDGQRAAADAFVRQNGGALIGQHVEVESGRNRYGLS
jgi:DNA invertase Pin-like site-specific DNA recombinase